MKATTKRFECRTERLILRPLRASDYVAWKSANEHTRRKQSPFDESKIPAQTLTGSAFKDFIAHMRTWKRRNGLRHSGVFLQRTGELVGYVMLFCIVEEPFLSATLGCRIFNHEWRQGYGKEALSGGLCWGFKWLNLHRIECPVEPANAPSIAMCQSCGMTNEGLSRKKMQLGDRWKDVLIFSAITEEWRGKRAKKRPVE